MMGARLFRLKHDWRPALRAALAPTLVLLLLALLNPFEVVQWSEQRSHDLWQRLAAHSYDPVAASRERTPPRRAPGTGHGRSEILVVYVDETTLKELGQTRPISTFALIDMIDDILLAGGDEGAPRAIFVDFLLTHAAPEGRKGRDLVAAIPDQQAPCSARRAGAALSPFQCLVVRAAEITRWKQWGHVSACTGSAAARLHCIRRAGGTPLLFADPRSPAEMKPGAAPPENESPALDALATIAVTVPVSVAPRAYPMVHPKRARDRENRRFELSPAAALYAVWCAAEPLRCRPSPVHPDRHGLHAWSERFESDVDVVWGIGGPSEVTKLLERRIEGGFDADCERAKPGATETAKRLIRLLASGINLPGKPGCPHTHAVPYHLFQSPIGQDELTTLLAGKLVLIGGKFGDSNDVVPAPPHGDIAGVHHHAMALDNLIERGVGYPRTADPVVGFLDLTWVDVASLVAAFLVAFVLALAGFALSRIERNDWESRRAWVADLMNRIAIGFIFGLVLLVLLLIMAGSVRLIPQSFNLVAVTLICLVGIARLLWTAIQPVRVLLLRQSAFARFWSGLFPTSCEECRRRAQAKAMGDAADARDMDTVGRDGGDSVGGQGHQAPAG